MMFIKRSKFFILFLCLILAYLKLPVWAEQSSFITFEGGKTDGEFYFGPGSEFSTSDLLTGLKDLMPGDVKTQTIRVNNNATDQIELVLYVKSNWIQSDSNDSELLEEEISVSFTADGKAEKFDTSPISKEQMDGWVLVGELNSEGTSEDVQDMSEWTYLGVLHMGGQVDIKATVSVPLTLDNTYQERSGEIDIMVQAEANPDSYFAESNPGTQVPGGSNIKTGDTSHIYLWMIVAAVSGVLSAYILIMIWRNRKKNKKIQNKEAED